MGSFSQTAGHSTGCLTVTVLKEWFLSAFPRTERSAALHCCPAVTSMDSHHITYNTDKVIRDNLFLMVTFGLFKSERQDEKEEK